MNDADVEDTLLLAMLVTDFANMIIKVPLNCVGVRWGYDT